MSTFGIGSTLTDKEWRSVARQCIASGYLNIELSPRQALQLTDAARAVLKGEATVWLRPLKREKTSSAALKDSWLRTEREERLWQALRAWRKQRAADDNVPAYVVFPDRTLQNIVQNPPQQHADLAEIYGMGEAKIDKFGADVLRICAEIAHAD